MMKKVLMSFVALAAIAAAATGPARAQSTTESFTITFKTTGSESDGSSAQTTIDGIIANGASYVSEVSATKVYNAQSGYGIKLGSSSATGSLTLTLANAVENVTSIVVNARQYGDGTSERTLQIQGQSYTTTDAFADYTYTYTTPATVSTITLATTTKRAYIKSVTVNYTTSSGGGNTEPALYTVKMAPGTEDSTSWSFNPGAAPTTGVAEGTVVNISYGGTRKVKSVVATVVPDAPTSITINDDGVYDVQPGETWQHFIQRQNGWDYDCFTMSCDSYGVDKLMGGENYDLHISHDGGATWTNNIFTNPSSPVDCTKQYKWVWLNDGAGDGGGDGGLDL